VALPQNVVDEGSEKILLGVGMFGSGGIKGASTIAWRLGVRDERRRCQGVLLVICEVRDKRLFEDFRDAGDNMPSDLGTCDAFIDPRKLASPMGVLLSLCCVVGCMKKSDSRA
jgi:hypothetical protein